MTSSEPRPFTTLWSDFGPYRVASIRDQTQRVAQPFTDYLDHIAALHQSRQKSVSAVRSDMQAKAYALCTFADFLNRRSIHLVRVSDKLLDEFKRYALEQVRSNKSSRGLEHQQRETTNVKLRAVYDFLFWCQSEMVLPRNTLGWDPSCRVRSSLVLAHSKDNDRARKLSNKYPLCFHGQGEGRPGAQHWADDSELDEIEANFWDRGSALTAARNSIMLRILDGQAWRISSANSLKTQQFSEEALTARHHHDEFTVTPLDQKGGKAFSFHMSWELARHIQQYCLDGDVGRIAIMRQLGVNEEVAKNAVFLSTTTGKPLCRHSWVHIFSSRFKLVGAPKGAGGHAIRRKRCEEETKTEIEYRLANGLPATVEAVSAAVQEKLGHSTADAQKSYRRVMLKLRRKSREEQLTEQLEKTHLELNKLRAQVAMLQEQSKHLLKR